jgi:hypothetical protein
MEIIMADEKFYFSCSGCWGAVGTDVETPGIMMDNQSVIALSKIHVLHARSKHIKTKFHFIRECVDHGEVALESVGTADQLTDILVKLLARVRFQELHGRIGVIKLNNN